MVVVIIFSFGFIDVLLQAAIDGAAAGAGHRCVCTRQSVNRVDSIGALP